MSGKSEHLSGPDLACGIPLDRIEDGDKLLGHAEGEPVLLVRQGDQVFAIGAVCTHQGGPLEKGMVVGETVLCPWHHACFSLRTGEVTCPPALGAVERWTTECDGDTVRVTGRAQPAAARPSHDPLAGDREPGSVVIVGLGAAGTVAVDTLRREGYTGRITVIDDDPDAPYDRTTCSKDFLRGELSADQIALEPHEIAPAAETTLVRGRAREIDTTGRRVTLENGDTYTYDRLLLATGAEPVRLDVPGADRAHVFYLRSQADSRAIRDAAKSGRRAVVIGASFIGMEVAASLRARDVEVQVVSREAIPFESVLGRELGLFLRRQHEEHGVRFHLEHEAREITETEVVLDNGDRLPADLVVIGIGVRPRTKIAEQAGLRCDNGIVVDEHLETSVPGIFAAGDIARWPDPRLGRPIRVEHWVVAERLGQTAARNLLGRRERFDAVPFFWTVQHDPAAAVSYIGHADGWDRTEIAGSPEAKDCLVAFKQDGRTRAVATVGRDHAGLEAERALETGDQEKLERLSAG